jgi:hypothetical protein
MAILVPANDVVALAERIHQLRHDFKQIPDQPVIRHLKNRRIRILVDRNDDLGFLHPGQMLDGTGDADREVELWRDDLAGLSDLVVIRDETGVDRSTAGAERGTELVGERFEQLLVVLATAQTATAGNDDLGGAEFGPFGFGQFAVGERALCRVGSRADAFDFCRISSVDRIKGGGADGDDLDGIGTLDGSQRVAGVDRADEGVGGFDGGDFGDLGDIEQGGDSWAEIFAEGGGRSEDVAVASGVGDDQCRQVLGGLALVVGSVGDFDQADALQCGGLLGGGAAVAAGDEDVDVATDFPGGGDGVEGGGLEALLVVFGDYEDSHLDHLGFVLEFVDQFGDVGDLDAGGALGRLADFEGGQAWRDVDAEVGRLDGVERLLLGFHDVGQGGVARFVEAEVGTDHGRQGDFQRFQATVNFAGDGGFAVGDHHF